MVNSIAELKRKQGTRKGQLAWRRSKEEGEKEREKKMLRKNVKINCKEIERKDKRTDSIK